MYRKTIIVTLGMMFLAGVCQDLTAAPKAAGSNGNGTFPSFIPFAHGAEGVAVDKPGNVYLSVNGPTETEVWKFSPAGEGKLLASLGPAEGGAAGLAIDVQGNIYVVKARGNKTGVYRVTPGGVVSMVVGTDRMAFPNALAFDPRGNLYITEMLSFTQEGEYGPGGVWWVPKGGTAKMLVQHELLTGKAPHLLGYPAGANGIAWFKGKLFIANTELGSVIQVPVVRDGVLGEPEVWAVVREDIFGAPIPFPPMLDGLALDVHGNVYVCVPSKSAIARIYAADRSQDVVAELPGTPLDTPFSLAFGTGKGDKQALYITNGGMMGMFLPGPWPGFGLVRVETGYPGMPLP